MIFSPRQARDKDRENSPKKTVLLQALMLKKLPRTAMVLGVLVGFGGVVLVSLPSVTAESEDKTQATGVALVLLATLCYGVSVNIATPIQQKYGSLPVMVRMLGLGEKRLAFSVQFQ
jgi:drug/metabolite transporter (DMT)-like permease